MDSEVSILNDLTLRYRFKVLRSRIGNHLLFSLGTERGSCRKLGSFEPGPFLPLVFAGAMLSFLQVKISEVFCISVFYQRRSGERRSYFERQGINFCQNQDHCGTRTLRGPDVPKMLRPDSHR